MRTVGCSRERGQRIPGEMVTENEQVTLCEYLLTAHDQILVLNRNINTLDQCIDHGKSIIKDRVYPEFVHFYNARNVNERNKIVSISIIFLFCSEFIIFQCFPGTAK